MDYKQKSHIALILYNLHNGYPRALACLPIAFAAVLCYNIKNTFYADSGTICPDTERRVTMKPIILTISREYGSGGREIAQNISDRLELPVFDRKLIDLTADQCGYSTKFIQENEERMTGLKEPTGPAPLPTDTVVPQAPAPLTNIPQP